MTKPLALPDARFLSAAIGWLELGNHHEANEELEKITPPFRVHPDVLEVRWQIYAAAKNWEACLDLANALVTTDFNRANGWLHRATALHELGRTQEAYDGLETGADLFPENWLVRYHLARYACQLKRMREAWQWLEDAIELGDEPAVKTMALDDSMLEPFWVEISQI